MKVKLHSAANFDELVDGIERPSIDTSDETKGIKAIIFLQSLAGITETEEDAKNGWEGMSQSEKENTLSIAGLLGDVENWDWTKEPEDR